MIFEHTVVLAHFPNIFSKETKRFQYPILYIELRNSIFIHQSWKNGEWCTGFGHDANGNGGADARLPFLNSKVVEQRSEYVLWSDSFRNKAKRIVGCSTDALLVGF